MRVFGTISWQKSIHRGAVLVLAAQSHAPFSDFSVAVKQCNLGNRNAGLVRCAGRLSLLIACHMTPHKFYGFAFAMFRIQVVRCHCSCRIHQGHIYFERFFDSFLDFSHQLTSPRLFWGSLDNWALRPGGYRASGSLICTGGARRYLFLVWWCRRIAARSACRLQASIPCINHPAQDF